MEVKSGLLKAEEKKSFLLQVNDKRASGVENTNDFSISKKNSPASSSRLSAGQIGSSTRRQQQVRIMLAALIALSALMSINAQHQSSSSSATQVVPQRDQGSAGGSSNLIGQVPISYAQDYSDNLINLGEPVYNNKRARKISAFMPMRGRKDGRDAMIQQQQQGHFNNQEEGQEAGLLGVRYSESESEPSIMRLVSASMLADDQQSPAAVAPPPPFPWTPSARNQFANQFAIRHMLLGQQQQQQQPLPASLRYLNAGGEIPDLGGQFLTDSISSQGVIMQAKPRRAFHPMRGKKSLSQHQIPLTTAELYAAAADELMANM